MPADNLNPMHGYGGELQVAGLPIQSSNGANFVYYQDLATWYATLAPNPTLDVALAAFRNRADHNDSTRRTNLEEVANILELTGDGIDIDMHDTTHLKTLGGWRTSVVGFKKAGTFTAQLLYSEKLYSDMIARVPGGLYAPRDTATDGKLTWMRKYPDGSFRLDTGRIKTLGDPDMKDDKIVMELMVELTGSPLFLGY